MIREEQIITTAKKHYYDDINCHNAFLHGVEWADEHPVDVWHEASEEPNGNNWEILCVDVYNGCWVDSRVNALLLYNKWNEYVDIEQVKMWAYVNNLLPKGGKE